MGVFHIKPCKVCGKPYQPTGPRSSFCGKECLQQAQCKIYHSTEEQYNRVNKSKRGFWVRLIHGRGKGKTGCRKLLTPEFLMAMYKAQDGLCAISGLPMNCVLKKGGDWQRCSIDRIDNSLGYHPHNVHLVCKGVNIGRNDQSLESFIRMCEAVTKHQENKNAQNNSRGLCETLPRLPRHPSSDREAFATQQSETPDGERTWQSGACR